MPRQYESPESQEASRSNPMVRLAEGVYLEVGPFRDEPWMTIRRWFRQEDGLWCRGKNGISLPLDAAMEVLAALANESTSRFVIERAKRVEEQLELEARRDPTR
jgi:hypothetical protein